MLLRCAQFFDPYMEEHVMALNHRWCVGVDLHKDTLTACVFCGCCGEVSFQKIACRNRRQIAEYFAALPRPHVVAIESVGFYRWLWEMLEPIVEELRLADATQARALAGRRIKTDREDALNIAQLLAAGRLPTSYAPPLEVQWLRDLTRHRNSFSRQHARILHRVKSIMNANNRPGPARMQSEGLIRYLKAQGEKLPARHVEMLWQCVDALVLTERQIAQVERTISELMQRDFFHEIYVILTSFPGVALVTAATVIAEIGDFKRFSGAKAIGRYAGLNPRVFASGGKQRMGHIAKTGSSDLRWILQQAAWTAIRYDEHVKRIFLRIAKRAGRKAAAVAIARKLITWIHSAVVKGEPYRTRTAA
jgi:transposase